MFLLVAENLCFLIVKMFQIWHCQPIVEIIDEPSPMIISPLGCSPTCVRKTWHIQQPANQRGCWQPDLWWMWTLCTRSFKLHQKEGSCFGPLFRSCCSFWSVLSSKVVALLLFSLYETKLMILFVSGTRLCSSCGLQETLSLNLKRKPSR